MKILAFAALLCAIAVAYGVISFNAYEDEAKDAYDIMKILMRPRTPERYMPKSYFHKYGIKQANKLTSFSFRNCDDPKNETVRFLNLEITPDPLEIPGNLGVAFGVDIFKTAQSPVKAVVQLKKRVLSNWVKLPCLDQFGSCTYDDFCEILDLIPECPQPFVDNGINCTCPFNVGNYTFPKTQFEVDVPVPLPPGDYFGQINMTMSGKPMACYSVTLTFT